MSRESNHAPTPWYADGLRFECQADCGACCSNHGDYEFVYLDDVEVVEIAKHLELQTDLFLERYTVNEAGWVVLRMDEPDCPFLEGNRCRVYPVRPEQCKTFPFWKENLRSRRSWERLSEFCPGVDRGNSHDLLQIRSELDRRES